MPSKLDMMMMMFQQGNYFLGMFVNALTYINKNSIYVIASFSVLQRWQENSLGISCSRNNKPIGQFYLWKNSINNKEFKNLWSSELQQIFSFLGTWETGKKLSAR